MCGRFSVMRVRDLFGERTRCVHTLHSLEQLSAQATYFVHNLGHVGRTVGEMEVCEEKKKRQQHTIARFTCTLSTIAMCGSSHVCGRFFVVGVRDLFRGEDFVQLSVEASDPNSKTEERMYTSLRATAVRLGRLAGDGSVASAVTTQLWNSTLQVHPFNVPLRGWRLSGALDA